jgi:hypothetical protein
VRDDCRFTCNCFAGLLQAEIENNKEVDIRTGIADIIDLIENAVLDNRTGLKDKKVSENSTNPKDIGDNTNFTDNTNLKNVKDLKGIIEIKAAIFKDRLNTKTR